MRAGAVDTIAHRCRDHHRHRRKLPAETRRCSSSDSNLSRSALKASCAQTGEGELLAEAGGD